MYYVLLFLAIFDNDYSVQNDLELLRLIQSEYSLKPNFKDSYQQPITDNNCVIITK